jgi:hypothetical protein
MAEGTETELKEVLVCEIWGAGIGTDNEISVLRQYTVHSGI